MYSDFFTKWVSSGCFKCHGGKALRMEKALHRPVYTRILIRVHQKKKKKKKKKGPVFFWKDGVFSFLFHFILFLVKNNLKMPTQLPEKWWTLLFCNRNTSLTLNCPRIQGQDYTKRNTETDTTEVRGRETYTCSTKNSELGIFQTGQNVSSTNVT